VQLKIVAKGQRPKPKKKKAFDLAFEQYKQLQEKLQATADMQVKNLIFRRLVNLLEVMQFLNQQAASHCEVSR